jgi:hypothetical protein
MVRLAPRVCYRQEPCRRTILTLRTIPQRPSADALSLGSQAPNGAPRLHRVAEGGCRSLGDVWRLWQASKAAGVETGQQYSLGLASWQGTSLSWGTLLGLLWDQVGWLGLACSDCSVAAVEKGLEPSGAQCILAHFVARRLPQACC